MGHRVHGAVPPEDGRGSDGKGLWSPGGNRPAGGARDLGSDGAAEFYTLYGDHCEYDGPGAVEAGDEEEDEEDDEYRSPSPEDGRDFYILDDPFDEDEMYERLAAMDDGAGLVGG
jgi:hypothetical protein